MAVSCIISEINRYIDRKSLFFHTPLHSTPPLGGGVPVGILPSRLVWKKLEWCGYPMVKKFRRYLYSFWHNSRTWQTERQTDRHTHRQTPHDGIGRAYASRGKNCRPWQGRSEPLGRPSVDRPVGWRLPVDVGSWRRQSKFTACVYVFVGRYGRPLAVVDSRGSRTCARLTGHSAAAARDTQIPAASQTEPWSST